MPKIVLSRKNESAASVFAQRQKDAFARINTLADVIQYGAPDTPDAKSIAKMDYLLKSLDGLIHDMRQLKQ